MLAVGIGQLVAGTAELRLELVLRVLQLVLQLGVGQSRQVGVRDRVRADRDPPIGKSSQLVPGHRRELVRIVTLQLGDRQRTTVTREPRADEDLDGHGESFESRKDGCRTPKRVVERRVDVPEAGQRANLAQQEAGLEAETVLPGRRDGVVAEDERPTRRCNGTATTTG